MNINGLTLNSPSLPVLEKALASGKLHHACLFTGPDGSGKTAAAVETALSLLCRAPDNRPCRTCLSCRKLLHYNHPDFRVVFPFLSEKSFQDTAKELQLRETARQAEGEKVTYRDLFLKYLSESAGELVRDPLRPPRMMSDFKDKNREITISIVRDLLEEVSMPPSESPFKVFLVAEADRMNSEAANALLKTLEEPPTYAKFLLVSSRPQRLLPTLRSRCQIVKFQPLQEADLLSYLESLPRTGGLSLRLASAFSDGSVREALSLLDPENLPLLEEALDMLEWCLSPGTQEALALSEAYSSYSFPDNVKRLRFFLLFLREAEQRNRVTGTGETGDAVERRLLSLTGRLPKGYFLRAFEKARTAMDALERKMQARLVFCAFFFSLLDKEES
ncbi:MAG: hypothetical protein A2293_05315 [Elusimicrobia bacterium RIFOXYB2_FULL_49_7]|nr:MAG: hypothetical protein A2293_05315 [Elusimicrobia bacterium RIFOXYB2_FULL_49_7]